MRRWRMVLDVSFHYWPAVGWIIGVPDGIVATLEPPRSRAERDAADAADPLRRGEWQVLHTRRAVAPEPPR